jgi:hypothetical protein
MRAYTQLSGIICGRGLNRMDASVKATSGNDERKEERYDIHGEGIQQEEMKVIKSSEPR